MVVGNMITLSELYVTSTPTLSFTLDKSLLIFFITIKNNESFFKIVFKHPIRTFDYDNIIIVLQKGMTRKKSIIDLELQIPIRCHILSRCLYLPATPRHKYINFDFSEPK